jgi:hypothetical protein
VECEIGQQQPLLAAARRHVDTVVDDRELAQQAHLHGEDATRAVADGFRLASGRSPSVAGTRQRSLSTPSAVAVTVVP